MGDDRRDRSAAPFFIAGDVAGSDPVASGGWAARSFTPLVAAVALLGVGAFALGVGVSVNGPVGWSTRWLLWLTAGAAAGISLSGSA